MRVFFLFSALLDDDRCVIELAVRKITQAKAQRGDQQQDCGKDNLLFILTHCGIVARWALKDSKNLPRDKSIDKFNILSYPFH